MTRTYRTIMISFAYPIDYIPKTCPLYVKPAKEEPAHGAVPWVTKLAINGIPHMSRMPHVPSPSSFVQTQSTW